MLHLIQMIPHQVILENQAISEAKTLSQIAIINLLIPINFQLKS